MRFEYKPSFLKQYRKLSETSQKQTFETIQKLIQFFETREKPVGLGLKQLRKPYWEIRMNIRQRILFRFEGDLVEFVLFGSHDEVNRFLKHL